MASAVDICNLALAHLGDTASVSSLAPPDGSAQAEHCARFYPVARNALLEMAAWNFSTRRAPLAEVTNPSNTWAYAYAKPNQALKVLAILPKEAGDDYVAQLPPSQANYLSRSMRTQQSFAMESDATGQEIILTNTPQAVARYTVMVTDTAKFSTLFTLALAWLLASMLAGPIIKGETGATEAKRCLQMFQAIKGEAVAVDADQRDLDIQASPPWIAGR